MKGRSKVIIVSSIMIAAFAYLVFIGMKEGGMYYLEVSEFMDKMAEIGQQKVRINGEVVSGSVHLDSATQELAFTMKDTKEPHFLNVVYRGAPPDLIEDAGVTLVAEGSYSKERDIFIAKQLLVKCPSKYEKKEDQA
jgi:cytochrome c-type biogenesis protein CcmE